MRKFFKNKGLEKVKLEEVKLYKRNFCEKSREKTNFPDRKRK